MTGDSGLNVLRQLSVGGAEYNIHSLRAAEEAGLGDFSRLPKSLLVLTENLLRNLNSLAVSVDDIKALGRWSEGAASAREVAYHPVRILMPDISGVPLLVDLSAMRDAVQALGGDPTTINPRLPIDLIIDHSVNVDFNGVPDALSRNMAMEYERNSERYSFVKWAQKNYHNIRVAPPGAGILHQVNVEHIGKVIWSDEKDGVRQAYPDALLGMDSHTPMINSLGIMGWGVGGLEAGAAMLGQPVSMLIPDVVGCRLTGALPEGTTATDLVLTVTQRLREHGVVGKFVEYCGPGLDNLPLTDRATISNMSPEYGATMGYFPIDGKTIEFLRTTGREDEQIALVEAYAKEQGLWRGDTDPAFKDIVDIDLSQIETSLAGPYRPNQRTPLSQVPKSYADAMSEMGRQDGEASVDGVDFKLRDGAVTIAAITSCTNTSNPAVMIGAGLLARNAVAKGLTVKPWVKTSLSPGSAVVADYLEKAGLQSDLDALGFNIVGFGCMSCGGLSGPLPENISSAISDNDLVVGAVLSGNRNFEGRVHPLCRVNYLASPILVVAYAIAGALDQDLSTEPLGVGTDGAPVYLKDVWPSQAEIETTINQAVTPDLYRARYATAFDGDERWMALPVADGSTFEWDASSTYIKSPPLFEGAGPKPDPIEDIKGARILVMAGDMTTTDHISPVGTIPPDIPAGQYLQERGVAPRDFNIYGARRTNHEVMIRGTFANIRFRNELAPGTEGGYTKHAPTGDITSIFEAAERYARDNTPLVVVAGDLYGTGSSRDWAAKGTKLLGVRAVIAEGLERIHRANLIGMGVLPLEFQEGVTRKTLNLDGSETFDIFGIEGEISPLMPVNCRITRSDGSSEIIELKARLDTEVDVQYYRHGGMLNYCLREALGTL
ncbi:MAG: aconitate hydratase [Alphaproteobacteria bacterium]|jgi:aconitate hydratase